MGWYLRKSVSFGPLRFNFSKSGVGASVGVRGARVGVGPRGAYVHMGAGGVYYRERIGGAPRRHQAVSVQPDYKGVTGPEQVLSTADVSALRDSSAETLIDAINSRLRRPPIWAAAGAAYLLAALLAPLIHSVLGLVVASIGVIHTALWYRSEQRKKTTPLFYELDSQAEARYNAILHTLSSLSRSQRIWRVVARQQNFDWKRNAGAANLIRRHPIAFGSHPAPFIASNIIPWCLNVGEQQFYFYPDRILVRQASRYGALSYPSLAFDGWTTRFIEDERVPGDSEVVDYTWQYVRRDGGPDLRFNNNRKLPIALYGVLRIFTASGLDLHLHISQHKLAAWFAEAFPAALRGTTRPSQIHKSKAARVSPAAEAAYRLLDLPIGAPYAQVQSAYRQLVKLYHPDKVSHLAPEFRTFAHQRMQELNAAVALLRKEVPAA